MKRKLLIRPGDDYFEIIDTKDKAYWLGLLYADGYVEKNRVGFSFSIHDEWFLEKVARTFKKYESSIRFNRQYQIRFNSTRMVIDLISHGCVPRKSKIIELPSLDSRELYLAFLLGFYDGDGQQKTTRIITGSNRFLDQIKEMFQLSSKIKEVYRDYVLNGVRIFGGAYFMCLGAELFNEMMDNYADSLPRKRKHFCTKEERGKKASESSKSFNGKAKIHITRDELKRLVWEMPAEYVAKKYGVSGKAIEKRCKSFGIEKPGRGYWAKQRATNPSA